MGVRRVLAAITDAALVAVLAYVAFRAGLTVSDCSDLSACTQLTPAILLAVMILVGAYFGASHLLWHRTPAQRVFGVRDSEDD